MVNSKLTLRVTKGRREIDFIDLQLPSSALIQLTRPKQGSQLPFELMAYIVETYFPVDRGLFYKILHQENLKASFEQDGAKKTECLIQCFQVETWKEALSMKEFQEYYEHFCKKKGIFPESVSQSQIAEVRTKVKEFQERWSLISIGESIEVSYPTHFLLE
jgi:hypothetical protein